MPDPVIIMVAPNGARKTHEDHPALPVSIQETVDEAVACHAAGATVLHAHVRDDKGKHVLDSGLYNELITEMKRRAPDMLVQTTSEAVGMYTPEQQVDCIKKASPEMASVALREITGDYQQTALVRDFCHWCVEANVHIQHILYSAEELQRFQQYKTDRVIPESQNCVLFVLGRYAIDFQSNPDDLKPFLEQNLNELNWFTCAFGLQEQTCVIAGINHGGHARIGFENNLHQVDGSIAKSTASQVESLVSSLAASDRTVANSTHVRQLLGFKSQ